MTKDEALKLALEALEIEQGAHAYLQLGKADHIEAAITAIKQARSAQQEHEPENEPFVSLASVREDWGPGPHEYHSLTAPVQEPEVRFKCTVIDEQHPNGAPLEQWGNSAKRQWVEVEQIKWDGEKLIAKLKEKNNG
jgi:hypothetical protein